MYILVDNYFDDNLPLGIFTDEQKMHAYATAYAKQKLKAENLQKYHNTAKQFYHFDTGADYPEIDLFYHICAVDPELIEEK